MNRLQGTLLMAAAVLLACDPLGRLNPFDASRECARVVPDGQGTDGDCECPVGHRPTATGCLEETTTGSATRTGTATGSDSATSSGTGSGVGTNTDEGTATATTTDTSAGTGTTTAVDTNDIPNPTGPDWAYWPMAHPIDSGLPVTPSFVVEDEVVSDQVTGLTWQRTAGTELVSQGAATAYCADTTTMGLDDWRLPSRIELVSLFDLAGGTGGSTGAALQDLPQALWTHQTHPAGPGYTVGVPTRLVSYVIPTDASAWPLCVRGGKTSDAVRYGWIAGQVIDSLTRLSWHRASDSVPARRFDDAATFCAQSTLAGHDDWRLPSVKELATIVDLTVTITIHAPAFPNTPGEPFWTATPSSAPDKMMSIKFVGGFSEPRSKNDFARVRCVRSIEPVNAPAPPETDTATGSN